MSPPTSSRFVKSSPRWKRAPLRSAVNRNGRRRLLFEHLEVRDLLALVTWDGGGDGVNWTDPINWSTNSLPGATDDVLIDIAANPTIHISSGTQSVQSLHSAENLVIDGGTLSLAQASQIDAMLT